MTRAALIYQDAALAELWRVVSLLDRNPHSRTRGSFSREHWGWKFVDFAYPRLQEGVYYLARIYKLTGHSLHGSTDLLTWIEWSLEYWLSRQNRNGSFDEAYPFEQSLAATSFTTFYIGSAVEVVGDHLAPELKARVLTGLSKACRWLGHNDESHGILSNHLAVAAAALEVVASLTGDPAASRRARYFVDRILAHQSADGWMKEYDGADIGYGTHALFYLADYWRRTKCDRTLDGMRKFTEFLRFFVHPDGTIGGEYASRNTEFYYPAGFEILKHEIPICGAIASFMRESIAAKRACVPAAMDTFNLFPMVNNMFFALDAVAPSLVSEQWPQLPFQDQAFGRYFKEAGLWIVNRPAYYMISAVSKGGTISFFDKTSGSLAGRHSGFMAFESKRMLTSQDYQLNPKVKWVDFGLAASFEVKWKELKIPTFTPGRFILFRLFTLTIGRLPAVSRGVKRLLVKVLINHKGTTAVRHNRHIRALDDRVQINDTLYLPESCREAFEAAQFTAVHMGSSLYSDHRAFSGSSRKFKIDLAPIIRLCGSIGPDGVHWAQE